MPVRSLPGFAQQVRAFVWKDLVSEWRTREAITQGAVFAFMVLFIFRVAFDLAGPALDSLTPGLLWTVVTFSGIVILNRAFGVERDQGTLDGLLLAPSDRTALYTGKAISVCLIMLGVESVALGGFVVLFNPSAMSPALLVVLLFGTAGFAAVGTLFAAIAVNTRSRDVLLPVLFFPAAIPILLPAVHATDIFLHHRLGDDPTAALIILAATALLFAALAFVTVDYVFEE